MTDAAVADTGTSSPAATGRILVVADRHEGAAGVAVLDLRDPQGAPLPAWTPGAHIDLQLPDGLVRQYSLCGDPRQASTWRVAVLRVADGRGGSAAVHDTLHPGSQVRVEGPRNNFALEPAQRYIFIAGGIGITPILPMIGAAQASGAAWELHYGGRSRASMAFLTDLAAQAAGDGEVSPVTVHPEDEVGLIDLAAVLGEPQPGTLVYACGPAPLLDAVESRCQSWPAGALHTERFSPKLTDHLAAGGFDVELSQSARTLHVPADKTILEVCEEAGISVLSSCREGTCGTCETAVLGGEVDHRDSLLTPQEQAVNDTMFICVSRAAAGFTLILDR